MSQRRPEVLILGIGNILMGDDGIGVRVLERLREQSFPDTVELVDGGTAGADLVDILADRRKAIVIDAVDIRAEPGTVIQYSGDAWIEHARQTISLHEVGLSQAVSMVRLIGAAPRELVVFGIQILRMEPSLELSNPVAEAIGQVVRRILEEVQS